MKRLLRNESGRFLAAVLVIALSVVLVMASQGLGVWRVDLTRERVMTPTQEALEVVHAINEPVTITFVIDDESEDIWVGELTRRYAAANSQITYKIAASGSSAVVNLSAQTGVSIVSGCVIVESDKRNAILTLDDLYSYEYDQMSYYTTGSLRYTKADFTAQNALVNALEYVTRDDMPVVYTLTGHGEMQADEVLISLCRRNAIDLKTLDLTQADAVPADASALLISGPASGYEAAQAALLGDYIAAGGHVLLLSDYESELGALETLAEQYGMALRGGLVLDGDNAHVYSSDYRYYLLPDVTETAYTQAEANVLVPVATALEESTVKRDTLTVQALLSTSDQAYRKVNTDQVATLEQEDGDETGRFVLGMAAEEDDGLFVWIGSTQILVSDADTVTDGGNSAFMLGLFDGMMTRPDVRELEPDSMLTSALSAPVWSLALVMALPLALLLAGLIVVRRTRRT